MLDAQAYLAYNIKIVLKLSPIGAVAYTHRAGLNQPTTFNSIADRRQILDEIDDNQL